MKIIKDTLPYHRNQNTNVLYFIPDSDVMMVATVALFGHGYTSDKSSIFNWPARLAEVGIPCALLDWPGHYLGNYSEVLDFNHFKNHAHELYGDLFLGLRKHLCNELPLNEWMLDPEHLKILLSGHSMGALLAIKAFTLEVFKGYQKAVIGVGIGKAPVDVVHLFETPFYKSTLNLREQLVSPELKPGNVFPWIQAEKEEMFITAERIHLISGEDDLVVGSDGMERFAKMLEEKGNFVTIEKPSKLPHHEPQRAASHIKKQLKKMNWY